MKTRIRKVCVKVLAFMFFVLSLIPTGINAHAAINWGRAVYISYNGQVVDSINFNGKTVNAVYAVRGSIANYDSDSTYCCAAFVSKFYREIYGIGVNNLYPGNTPNIYSGSGSFSKTTTPRVGDIAGSSGHWAIVKAVSGTTVTLIEQNCWNKAYDSAMVGRTLQTSGDGYWFWRYSGSVTPSSVSFADQNINSTAETNAEVYVKIMNPNGATVSTVGCRLYNASGTLLKDYTESCGLSTSYVNYTCNFNNDMKYTLAPGNTYKYQQYAIVGGKEYADAVRSFTTPATITFQDQNLNFAAEKNAEVYVKIMNPNGSNVSTVGCRLYNASGTLLKNYTENCGLTTSYVNYNCNFNNDMKYELTGGTTYKYQQYAIVGGKEYADSVRTFTTTKPSLSVTASANTTSAKTGEKVTVSATANGGAGNYTYSFIIYNKKTGASFRFNDFQTSNKYVWNVSGSGDREFYVEVKDGSGTVVKSSAVNVSITDIQPLTINASVSAATVSEGSSVVLKGIASGGNGNYTYSYLVHNKDNETWYRFSSFTKADTYTWIAGSAGNREFFVEAKDSTGTVVRSKALSVKVENKNGLSIVAGTSNSAPKVGTKISIVGTAVNGSKPYTYSFLVHNKDNNTWYRFTSFTSNNSYVWTAGSVGNREFFVEVKDAAGKVIRSNAVNVNVTK